jgi:hypothetical protein
LLLGELCFSHAAQDRKDVAFLSSALPKALAVRLEVFTPHWTVALPAELHRQCRMILQLHQNADFENPVADTWLTRSAFLKIHPGSSAAPPRSQIEYVVDPRALRKHKFFKSAARLTPSNYDK